MIRQQHLAAACFHNLKIFPSQKSFKSGKLIRFCNQIVTPRFDPQHLQLGVVDKYVRDDGCVRAVFQVAPPPIQEQFLPAGIERHGRKRVVMAIRDDFAGRALQNQVRHIPRREQRIEADERQPGALKKNDHHQRRGEINARCGKLDGADNAEQKGSGGDRQRFA